MLLVETPMAISTAAIAGVAVVLGLSALSSLFALWFLVVRRRDHHRKQKFVQDSAVVFSSKNIIDFGGAGSTKGASSKQSFDSESYDYLPKLPPTSYNGISDKCVPLRNTPSIRTTTTTTTTNTTDTTPSPVSQGSSGLLPPVKKSFSPPKSVSVVSDATTSYTPDASPELSTTPRRLPEPPAIYHFPPPYSTTETNTSSLIFESLSSSTPPPPPTSGSPSIRITLTPEASSGTLTPATKPVLPLLIVPKVRVGAASNTDTNTETETEAKPVPIPKVLASGSRPTSTLTMPHPMPTSIPSLAAAASSSLVEYDSDDSESMYSEVSAFTYGTRHGPGPLHKENVPEVPEIKVRDSFYFRSSPLAGGSSRRSSLNTIQVDMLCPSPGSDHSGTDVASIVSPIVSGLKLPPPPETPTVEDIGMNMDDETDLQQSPTKVAKMLKARAKMRDEELDRGLSLSRRVSRIERAGSIKSLKSTKSTKSTSSQRYKERMKRVRQSQMQEVQEREADSRLLLTPEAAAWTTEPNTQKDIHIQAQSRPSSLSSSETQTQLSTSSGVAVTVRSLPDPEVKIQPAHKIRPLPVPTLPPSM
ncbi:hypothetical protein D9758_003521 [Tetrapyrgos nigripes]|uniref:Uncharacterized protein n=1 Tax=Tetrapyrgos nigripes TaxID=182062 RepID=A0A8H5GUW7_9AGAR|nr:hypothetical protein D9758_003521 [Tetrapyrgos nigripes]